MKFRQFLLSAMLILSLFGITRAQNKSEYNGTFTNVTLTQSGTVAMRLVITLPDSIKGYMNFSEHPGQSPLCGAGSYAGGIINTDSLYFFFSSHDTDSNCGFDWGWGFTLNGKFYSNRDSIAGAYVISNATNETGFFNLRRVVIPTAISTVKNQLPIICPNPSAGKLAIRLQQYPYEATAIITDQIGRKVYQKQLYATTTEISPGLPDGLYFISIISGELYSTQRLVIRH